VNPTKRAFEGSIAIVTGGSTEIALASEMLSFVTMAIVSKMQISALKEVVQLFLTFSEAFSPALEALRF